MGSRELRFPIGKAGGKGKELQGSDGTCTEAAKGRVLVVSEPLPGYDTLQKLHSLESGGFSRGQDLGFDLSWHWKL